MLPILIMMPSQMLAGQRAVRKTIHVRSHPFDRRNLNGHFAHFPLSRSLHHRADAEPPTARRFDRIKAH